MYTPVNSKQNFPKLEEEILAFWEKNDIFRKSVLQREEQGAEEYVFYDGPPFATGLPHFGHFVPSTIKDIIPRYQTMRGKKVERRFGWDCHGLPVENLIEKELGLNSKTDIERYGVAKFNEACRASVLRYVAEWRRIITRLGRWVDFDNDYKTMEAPYMESIWAVMRALHDRGLLYEGHYILPYCPRCATVLSNHELNLGGYKDVHDPAVTVRFKIVGSEQWAVGSTRSDSETNSNVDNNVRSDIPDKKTIPDSRFPNSDTYFLAWTTTPWTLPSNLALAVGPEIEYALIAVGSEQWTVDSIRSGSDTNSNVDNNVRSDLSDKNLPTAHCPLPTDRNLLTTHYPLPTDENTAHCPLPTAHYILAAARIPAYFKEREYTVLARFTGTELAGLEYEPLFPYFAGAREQNAFRVYTGGHVTTEDGTGIVHTAPGFGEDDQRILAGTGVPTICPVDAECRFTKEVPDYAGRFVKDCDRNIIERLKNEGKLVKRDQILHAYPHCWRCGSPLIYRAVGSWFVNVQKIKADMLAANAQIEWVPEHIKAGRFGKWLEGARDWAISRNRYWGNPLPIWKCPDCGKTICIGSRAELAELSGVSVEDLHKHFVDEIVIPCGCGGTMRRIPEVLDCWFESGAMPYAQSHYPFENKAFFESHFPADFINEGLDQTRGWFYTLTILAAALFKRPAFKHCIVSGLVLAQDGKKMSKSLRNYTDPMDAVNEFGADALRLFLIHSAVVKADDLRYSDEGVREVLKSIIIPLWNAYGFFVTYANIDGVTVGSEQWTVDSQGTGDRGQGIVSSRREPSTSADSTVSTDIPDKNLSPTPYPLPPDENTAHSLDRWIISAAQSLIRDVTAALDAYDLAKATEPVVAFIDDLNNWYIRRSRRRFWRAGLDADKQAAYAALYRALRTLTAVAAPFMPFTTEAVYRNLRGAHEPESVHLCDWPAADEALVDRDLEFRMAAVMRAVQAGRALRSRENIKVRQPLRLVELVTRDAAERTALAGMLDIVAEELNVKEARLGEREEELVEYQAKANFRVLGKKLGASMKSAAALIEALPPAAIAAILDGGSVPLDVDGKRVMLTAANVDVKRTEKAGLKVLNEGSLTVALDTTITDDLLREGIVRDLVRGIQNIRKEAGFDVSDRIRLFLFGSPRLREAWEAMRDFVSGETLAVETVWGERPDMQAVEADTERWLAAVERV